MKGGTLFSGIGAPEFACPEIDWRWCAEIDPFASAVHRKRFPAIRNLGDVEKINVRSVEPVDLVVFGSPCQSFSIAGRRAGLDDPRGNLALVGLGLVAKLRPRWIVWENVPGVLSSDGGRDFGTLLRAVEQCGYGWAYRRLDAQYFGLAQRRLRLFVVGHLGDWRRSAEVLFEPESLRGHPPPRRNAWEGTAPTLASRATAGGGLGTDFDCDGGLIAYGGNNTAGAIELATAVRAKGGTGHGDFDSETFVAYRLYGGNSDVVEGAKAMDAIGAISANNNRVGNSGSHILLADPISAHEAAHLHPRGARQFPAAQLRPRSIARPPPDPARVRTPPGLSRRLYRDPLPQRARSRRAALPQLGQLHGSACHPVGAAQNHERKRMTIAGEFSVWVFMPDDIHFPIMEGVDAKTAVDTACRAMNVPGGAARIIITDGEDNTCFEWVKGKGMTYPRKGMANDHTQSAAGNG